MSSFSYDKKNDKLYLTYIADVTEIVDGYTLGIVINNPIIGIAQTLFSNDENGKKFTYDITGTMSLKELIKKGIDEKLYMCLLASVSTTLHSCEQNGLNIGSLILNEELIYCNEENGLVYFICIPTSGFITSVHEREVLAMFSNVLMNRMEVTNNTILDINEYLVANPEYVYADFIYKINEYLVANNIEMSGIVQEKTRQTIYKEEPEKTRKPEDKKNNAENLNEEVHIEQPVNNIQVAPVINNAVVAPVNPQPGVKMIIKEKMTSITRAIGNIKNSQAIKGLKDKIQNIQVKKSNNNVVQPAQNINQIDVVQPVQNMNQVGVVQNVQSEPQNVQGVPQNNMIYQIEQQGGETLMLDCVTGETEGRNSISTAEPYLVRVSTGEKINITQSNFKIGRSKKNADYSVEDNDTISKVHAYITNKANQYFIVDNASSNKTFLDGKVIKPIEENKLNHESKIRLAKEEFVFYLY